MKFMRLLMAVAALLLITPAATAHEELVDFSPVQGQIVQAGLIDISLTFSDDLISLEGGSGNEILVLQLETGALLNNGCAQVTSRNAITKVDLDKPGEYEISWRAVSSDGHPITGSHSFFIENADGYLANENYQFQECPNAITQVEQDNQDSAGSNYWIAWVPISAVAAGLFLFLRPKRK